MTVFSLLIRVRVEGSVHRADAGDQADSDDNPRIHGHQLIGPATGVKSASCKSDNPDTEAGVHKGLIEERALKRWHAPIFPCLPVEQQIRCQSRASHNCSTINESLRQVAGWLLSLIWLLHVCTTEDILKDGF